MDGFLTIVNRCLAFSDAEATSQPQLKEFDWALKVSNISVEDARSFGGVIAAGSSTTVFDGTRATTIDGTTAFDVELSSLDAGSRYRFTWTGGTNPTLRTDRALTLSGQSVTVQLNADASVNFLLGGGSFGATVAGDIIYIPGVVTGDAAGPFNASNAGFWVVLVVNSSTDIQATRLPGESFDASGETVAVTANSQFQAFSAAGVQVGDGLTISAGFAVATRRSYVVDRVTSTWFEVISTAVIPAETGKLPTASGLIFYTDSKRFLHLEVDQEAVAQFDGDTGETNRLSPVQAGDPRQPAWLEKFGACRKLVVVNKASVPLKFIAHTVR